MIAAIFWAVTASLQLPTQGPAVNPQQPNAPLGEADLVQPTRLRTILPNGAVILVEQEPGAKKLDMQLFVSSRSTPETAVNHGRRHLLEHLMAKGTNRDLDKKLERAGAFLTAETTREATEFSITLRADDLKLGLGAIAELGQLGQITPAEISHETEVIRQEAALETPSAKLSQAAWLAAFGADGLDAFGDPDDMGGTTPEQLHAIHKAEFIGPNLVLVVHGDVDLDDVTRQATTLLGAEPGGNSQILPKRDGKPAHAEPDTTGEVRAALVGDPDSKSAVARLSAALGLASQIGQAFVTYTPSARGGLILVGQDQSGRNLGKSVDGMDPALIYGRGKELARRWIEREADVSDGGDLRGLLLSEGAGFRPETMLENLKEIRYADFQRALSAFQGQAAVSVIGSLTSSERTPPLPNSNDYTGAPKAPEPGHPANPLARVVDSSATEISIATVAPLPKLGARDLQRLKIGMQALIDGSHTYPRATMLQATNGRQLHWKLMPDCAEISVSMPAGAGKTAISLISSIIQDPGFLQESLDRAIAILRAKQPDFWDVLADPVAFGLGSAEPEAVEEVFKRVFRPDKTVVAIGGKSIGPELDVQWASSAAGWAYLPDRDLEDDTAVRTVDRTGDGVTAAALDGAVDSSLDPSTVLALYALGSGKCSSLFRVSRERHGWSYRQEAYLWPSPGGWTPRLFLAMIPSSETQDRLASLKTELAKDIDSWTDADRDWAIGMADASLMREVPFGPILNEDRPVGTSLEDRTVMEAYWRVKTGSDWIPGEMLGTLRSVTLDQMKKAATQIVTSGTWTVVKG